MILNEVSFLIAFGAGFLSFFSPCILPLIPAYIMYITGTNAEDELRSRKFLALSRTLGFILGFTVVFMLIGISAGSIGQASIFKSNKDLIIKISSVVIIIFGLNMLGIFKMRFLNTQKRIKLPKITNWFSAILMGMAFAAGWTPCFGPILGSIVLYAGTQDTAMKGLYLLLVYSIGMAIPFILTSIFINLFDKLLNKADRFMPYITKISGIILILFGVMMFSGYLSKITSLLTKFLPVY